MVFPPLYFRRLCVLLLTLFFRECLLRIPYNRRLYFIRHQIIYGEGRGLTGRFYRVKLKYILCDGTLRPSYEPNWYDYNYGTLARQCCSGFPTHDSVDIRVHSSTPIRTVLVHYQEQGDLCASPETDPGPFKSHDRRRQGLRIFRGLLVPSLH